MRATASYPTCLPPSTRRWPAFWVLLVWALLLSLSGCGGGGGSGATAGSGSATTVVAQGVVVNDQGVPLPDATVQVVSSSGVAGTDHQASTDAEGRFSLTLDAATPAVLRIIKAGHASSLRAVSDAAQNESVALRVILLPVAATISFDASQATVLRVPGSTARVSLAAASLVREDGQPIVGAVTATLTPVDPSVDPWQMPGLMVDGDTGVPIESLGALGVEFTDASGAAVNLADGQTAVIRIPATPAEGVDPGTLPASYPLYHLNETTGLWTLEGSATLGTDPVTGERFYEGTVSHFSWWNADLMISRTTVNLGQAVGGAVCSLPTDTSVVSVGVNYNGVVSALNGQVFARAESQAQVRLLDRSGRVLDTVTLTTGLAGAVSPLPRCLQVPERVRISGRVTVSSGSLEGYWVALSGPQVQTVAVGLEPDGRYELSTYAGLGAVQARLVSSVQRGTPDTSVSGVVGTTDVVLPDLVVTDTRFTLNGCVDGWSGYRQTRAQVRAFKGTEPLGAAQTVSASSPNFAVPDAPLNSTLTLVLTPDDATLAERRTELVVGSAPVSPGSCLALPEGPTAVIAASGTGLDRSLDASNSSSPDGAIVSAQWLLGDGNSATGLSTSHRYATSGSYTVTLTVTDALGQQATTSTPVIATEGSSTPALARRQISGNELQSCWVDGDGGVLCATANGEPTPVPGLSSGIVEVAMGLDFACALSSGGTVSCWGNNSDGALGQGGSAPYSPASSSTPLTVSGLGSGVVGITAGANYACALTSAGGVLCWGNNFIGQLGTGNTTASGTPVPVVGLSSGVVAISAGYLNTCAATSGAGVQCWGANTASDGSNSSTPVQVEGLSAALSAISVGRGHGCAVTTAGAVYCWGANSAGQLGNGSTTDSRSAVMVTGASSGYVTVSTGRDHSCALTSTNEVYCWGFNDFGRLGNGSTTSSAVPVRATEATGTIIDLGLRDYASCVLRNDRSVQCWGWAEDYIPGG